MSVVLVLTTESSIAQICWQALSRVGHEVVSVRSAADAARAAMAIEVSAVVIDAAVGADDMEAASAWFKSNPGGGVGMVFLASVRTRPGTLPIDPENDQLVVKPCSPDRLRQALGLATTHEPPPDRLLVGGIELSRADQSVRNGAGTAMLTPREFQIIEYLAAHCGRFVPAAELAEKIWRRPRSGEYSSIVSTSMKNLRDKLQPLTNGKALIETFPRRGYLLHN